MIIPKIHLNGTSGDQLLEQTCSVMTALNDALDAMRKATPNGRDYYTLGDGMILKAQDEFKALYRSIEDVRSEFEVLAMAIDAQLGETK